MWDVFIFRRLNGGRRLLLNVGPIYQPIRRHISRRIPLLVNTCLAEARGGPFKCSRKELCLTWTVHRMLHCCYRQEFSISPIKEFAASYTQLTLRSPAVPSVDLFVNEITSQKLCHRAQCSHEILRCFDVEGKWRRVQLTFFRKFAGNPNLFAFCASTFSVNPIW
jgi:hypothetical protein